MELEEETQPSELAIAGYTIGATLGTGTFGKVKQAKHVLTGVTVAVKILNRSKVKALRMDNKIKREIQILQLFRHPHIIRMYEVIETATDVFMFLEYVSGGELFDLIVQRGKLDETDARRFFQQIISGVEYCHQHRVVHRDLKPENLLLDGNAQVKIADFGLSNIMEDGAFLQTSCGSPNYAAPEVISGQMYSGQEIDIWSCGVILYAFVVGKLPFDEDYIPTLFQKIRGGIYQVPSFVSGGCSNLIGRLLDVNPISRITVDEIKRHPWYVVDLPDYLAAGHKINKSTIRITDPNPAIVDMIVERCGGTIKKDFVLQKLAEDTPNDVIVSYNLLLDSNPHLRISVSNGNLSSMQSVESADALDALKEFATSPHQALRDQPDWAGPGLSQSLIPQSQFPSNSPMSIAGRGARDSANKMDEGDDDADDNLNAVDGTSPALKSKSLGTPGRQGSPGATSGGKNSWYLGCLTEKNPDAVMAECYRVLRMCDFEWKTITKYHVRVRPVLRKIRTMSMQKKRKSIFHPKTSIAPGNENVKFELQLYRVNANQCLLDFKRLSEEGTTMGYLTTVNLLISCLNLNTK